MSNHPKSFSDEEKARIAKEAAAGGDETVKKLAKTHNLSEEEIQIWVRETSAVSVTESDDEISLEASDDFIKSVEYGATFDHLNYRRLTFWSLFGTATIILFIVGVMFMHEFNRTSSLQVRSAQSIFYEIEQKKQAERTTLESFGVVDPEEGIYRIPIDSAITIIATD